jgi:hypothetical protein
MTYLEHFLSVCTEAKLGYSPVPIMTVQELRKIPINVLFDWGFGNWDNHLVLLPEWFLDWMKHNESLQSINGNIVNVGVNNIDRDTRRGCIA